MGRPLAHVPDPAGDCHASYARHFAGIFIDTFAGLGIVPDRYYWMSDIYPTGQMDPFIRTALDRAATVREVYRRVANVQHPDHWLPRRRHLPQLRQGRDDDRLRLGRRDGERSRASPTSSQWATGCGWTGRVSPFGGDGEAALEPRVGGAVEPVRRDDRAQRQGPRHGRRVARPHNAIAREVFEREPPLNFPYEFLNIGGKKMSTSKGRGAAAHTIGSVIPPEQLRFLFVRQRPESALDFDPEGTDAIPRLFDEFDRLAAATAGREVKGELPSRPRVDLPLLAPRSRRGRRGRGRRVPAGVRPPRAARPGPGHRRPGAGRGGEGRAP